LLSVRADRCVGVSPAVLGYLHSTARIPEHKTRLIVNGISAPLLASTTERVTLRASLEIPADAFVIGSVGRLDDGHKRFSDLIRAMPALLNRVPSALLLIVGDGRDRQLLERLAADLGVTACIRFAGYRHDVGPVFSIMDLFALASERESFGLVLVEAMFSGLPVVATEVGGIPGIVANGETGLLVPVGAPAALADAVATIANDAARRSGMGQAGAARAHRLFGAERYVKDVELLYKELL
jgi:glycosyltransferase involved in cell wall biosynthesis